MIIIKSPFGNVNEEALLRAKKRLDMILTDRQKQELIKKLENTDRSALMEMLGKIDLSGLDMRTVENLLENTNADEIMKRFKNM